MTVEIFVFRSGPTHSRLVSLILVYGKVSSRYWRPKAPSICHNVWHESIFEPNIAKSGKNHPQKSVCCVGTLMIRSHDRHDIVRARPLDLLSFANLLVRLFIVFDEKNIYFDGRSMEEFKQVLTYLSVLMCFEIG